MTVFVRLTPFNGTVRIQNATDKREKAFAIEDELYSSFDEIQVWEDGKIVELWYFAPEDKEWHLVSQAEGPPDGRQ